MTFTACGGSGTGSSTTAGGKLKVAASLPPFEDLAKRVGGDRVEVLGIVPAGVDGHTYEPTPGDVKGLSQVAVLFLPDPAQNPKVTNVAKASLKKDAKTVSLNAKAVPQDQVIYSALHSHGDQAAHGDANVHTWTNIPYASAMVDDIAATLTEADPDGKATYETNRDKLKKEIGDLEAATKTAMATVPEKNRTLVVYHDSWSYFGRTYGFKVVGALQAVDFSEPSAAEMRKMVGQVQGAKVPAFFGSVVFPTKVLEQVGSESGVKYVGNLADDKLPGNPGDKNHSYVGMMTENVRTIVTGLGGDASAIDAVDPARG